MTPVVLAETDLAGTTKSEYIFIDGERVARRDGASGTGGVFYYFSDNLKTASVITDSAGVIKAESDYYPWGGELQFVNNDSNDYKFTGKKRDIETGLDYFGARYYSNGLGRWVSADWSAAPVPVPYADFGDPQSLNQYGYVRNVPTTSADADGHDCEVCPKLVEKVEQLARDPKIVATALAGTAKATAIEGSLVVGGTAALAAPSVGGMAIVVLGPKYEVPEGCGGDCSSFYIPPPQAEGQNQQGQTQPQLGQGRGADEDKSQSDDARDKARTNGGLAKPDKGPGSVPKDQRDSKRVWTKSENDKKLDQQKGLCASCGKPIPPGKVRGHHIHRHADGARTVDKEHAVVCDDCHKDLHR
jgi:RHS repeat-associated protein